MSVICRVVEASRSGYYSWFRRPLSRRRIDDARLLVEIRAEFKASKNTYGRDRMRLALKDKGISCGRNRVIRLMKKDGLKPRQTGKFKATTLNGSPMWLNRVSTKTGRDQSFPASSARWTPAGGRGAGTVRSIPELFPQSQKPRDFRGAESGGSSPKAPPDLPSQWLP
ncbi:MAG: transposase [Nitrospinae bacterium]|nr:transposase [Nitrospinota bacterium]